MLNKTEFSKWTNEEILNWLKDIKYSGYIDIFKENEIQGYDLCYIKEEDLLNEFKLTRFHDRMQFFKEIKDILLEKCINIII
jgi:hypothetical protein